MKQKDALKAVLDVLDTIPKASDRALILDAAYVLHFGYQPNTLCPVCDRDTSQAAARVVSHNQE